jgi:expansin (peptidoglycan-binding protein)
MLCRIWTFFGGWPVWGFCNRIAGQKKNFVSLQEHTSRAPTFCRWLGVLALAWGTWACGDGDGGGDKTNDNSNDNTNVNTTVDPECNTARVTYYTASDRGWCGFSRNLEILPQFVRDGMTFAMAEPWNGGSYGGDPGEGCGECWEISNSWATQVVMMHDLCPIEGNPVCAGEILHFDLSSETAEAIQSEGSAAIVARPVPCPVSGNIHTSIGDWNEWGYHKVSFVNHRIPVRRASIRAHPDGPWIALERSGGRWTVLEGPEPGDGQGVVYRLESAQGEVVESTNVLPFTAVDPNGEDLVFDIGVQFEDLEPAPGVCEFEPPGLVYGDDWGGIPGVKWMPNPWGDTQVSETSEGCHGGSASCLRVDHMGLGQGMHIYIWQPFPPAAFTALTVWARTLQGTSPLALGPSHDGDICGETEVEVGPEWEAITIPLSPACDGMPVLSSVTLHHGSGEPLLLDDIAFE